MAVITSEMNLGVYRDSTGGYRWRLWSGLRPVAISAESFDDRMDAELAALYFTIDARDATYDVVASAGSWYWQARDGAGQRLAIASRRFDSRSNAQHAAADVSNNVARTTFS